MSQASPISNKQIERSILKNAKKVIIESGIDPSTRSGNKELDHVVKLLAKQPIDSLTAASKMGEELGQRIVSLSQTMGRTHLDQGVLRQLRLQKDLFAGVAKSEVMEKATEVVLPATVAKTIAKPIETTNASEPVASVLPEKDEQEEKHEEDAIITASVEEDEEEEYEEAADDDDEIENEPAIDPVDESKNGELENEAAIDLVDEDEDENEEIESETTIDSVEAEEEEEEETASISNA